MITAALVLALLNLASASTQTPSLTPCSENQENDVVTVSDVTVYNAVVGDKMSFEYKMDISEEISGVPVIVFEMTSGDEWLPCFESVGSCSEPGKRIQVLKDNIEVKSNPDDDVITTSDVTVYNAVVGDLMTAEYTMDVSEEIDDDPLVAFEMSSGDSRLPCYENFGSW
ncbi:hypothetical protein MTO96_031518 [Rhipicephalus appendiculatus]